MTINVTLQPWINQLRNTKDYFIFQYPGGQIMSVPRNRYTLSEAVLYANKQSQWHVSLLDEQLV